MNGANHAIHCRTANSDCPVRLVGPLHWRALLFYACATCLPVLLAKLQIANADRWRVQSVLVNLRAITCAGEWALLAVLDLHVRN